MATISKTSTFAAPKFSQSFSPLSFPSGSACGAWAMGPRLPEAEHRCTWQPRTAASRSSSGSSRPRRRWLRRTKTAVASDEGFLGRENPPEAMGSSRDEVDEMLMVQVILDASLFCGKCFAKTFGTDILCCSL